MQQTLLAVLAIVVLGLFSLGQQRDVAKAEREVYTHEMQERAAEKVRALLQEIQALPFDEVDINSPRLRTSTAGLSPLGPESDEASRASFDDVDDYDGYGAASWLGHGTVADGHAQHRIYLRVAVRYVRADAPEVSSAVPTLAKEVIVEGFYGDGTPAPDAEPDVRLSQVVTPSWHQIHG